MCPPVRPSVCLSHARPPSLLNYRPCTTQRWCLSPCPARAGVGAAPAGGKGTMRCPPHLPGGSWSLGGSSGSSRLPVRPRLVSQSPLQPLPLLGGLRQAWGCCSPPPGAPPPPSLQCTCGGFAHPGGHRPPHSPPQTLGSTMSTHERPGLGHGGVTRRYRVPPRCHSGLPTVGGARPPGPGCLHIVSLAHAGPCPHTRCHTRLWVPPPLSAPPVTLSHAGHPRAPASCHTRGHTHTPTPSPVSRQTPPRSPARCSTARAWRGGRGRAHR